MHFGVSFVDRVGFMNAVSSKISAHICTSAQGHCSQCKVPVMDVSECAKSTDPPVERLCKNHIAGGSQVILMSQQIQQIAALYHFPDVEFLRVWRIRVEWTSLRADELSVSID